MDKLNILVTGAAGFIGRTLVLRLDPKKYNISAFDNKDCDDCSRKQTRKFFKQDLTESFRITDRFDCVVHLAALNTTHVGKVGPDAYYL